MLTLYETVRLPNDAHSGAVALGDGCILRQLPEDPEEHGICAGGPVDELQQPLAYLSFGGDYGPPILNSLAVLMLSFYANTCLGLYARCLQLLPEPED